MKIGAWMAFGIAAFVLQPCVTHGAAAEEPAADGPLAALSFLVGQWEGDGWSQQGPGPRQPVHVVESVTPKLGGTVLLIEGKGATVDPETGEERIEHEALAVIGHDPASGYHMRAFRSGSGSVDPTLIAEDGTVQWHFDIPGRSGRVRYTITLNDEGQWFEVGEFSRDEGQTWLQFFEMTLDRKGDAAR